MTDFRWALIGPGPIAHAFAAAVAGMDGAALTRVLGRDAERACAFAAQWCKAGSAAATTQLNDVLHANDVDAVYIATPHAFHAESIRACLNAGKPVLCEKPLVTDAATAAALTALAREKNVFLMEAVWTRFLPIYAEVRKWLQSGAIGPLRTMQSSFCFNTPFNPVSRLFDPAQAGGALLDIGIYNLTITRWVMACALGECPPALSILSNATLGPTGVDHRVAATIEFPGGVSSQFVCALDSDAANAFLIFGERGTIALHAPFWGATTATLAVKGEAPVVLHRPHRVNGFEYEIDEAMRCIREGRIESAEISHEETRQTLEWIDTLRAQAGVRYPFEA
jgi:predicted dehydrogenase